MKSNLKNKILTRIYRHGRGWAFCASDFLNIAGRATIDSVLSRLSTENKIQKVITGIYSYPLQNKLSKNKVNDFYQVAQAIARKFGWRIIPDGNTALNYLGLSTQLVANALYYSDGPNKTYTIDNRILTFKHTAIKEINFRNSASSLIIQSFKAIGENNISQDLLQKIAVKYSLSHWKKIKKDTQKVTGWIYKHISDIVKEQEAKYG